MSKYGSVVKNALNESVKTVLLNAVEAACGPAWYDTLGRPLLSGYSDYHKMEANLEKGLPLADVLDFVAVMYLLFPYEKGENGRTVSKDSPILDRLTEKYALQSWQQRKLSRLRVIRNAAEHAVQEENGNYSLDQLYAGAPERDWLTEAEQTVSFLQPGFSLAKYKQALDRKVAESSAEQKDVRRPSIFMTETQAARKELRRYDELPFLQAPIGQPIIGAAPWAKCGADLEDLPWPSVVVPEDQARQQAQQQAQQRIQAKKQPLSQRDQVIGALFGDEKTRETVIKMADAMEKGAGLGLEKGLGKLLGKFGRK